jgi:hypothetical protein
MSGPPDASDSWQTIRILFEVVQEPEEGLQLYSLRRNRYNPVVRQRMRMRFFVTSCGAWSRSAVYCPVGLIWWPCLD